MLAHVRDGQLFTHWDQTAAATGRLTSTNPNIQAIPKQAVILAKIQPTLSQPGTLWCRYNTVDFLQNTHNRHPHSSPVKAFVNSLAITILFPQLPNSSLPSFIKDSVVIDGVTCITIPARILSQSQHPSGLFTEWFNPSLAKSTLNFSNSLPKFGLISTRQETVTPHVCVYLYQIEPNLLNLIFLIYHICKRGLPRSVSYGRDIRTTSRIICM